MKILVQSIINNQKHNRFHHDEIILAGPDPSNEDAGLGGDVFADVTWPQNNISRLLPAVYGGCNDNGEAIFWQDPAEPCGVCVYVCAWTCSCRVPRKPCKSHLYNITASRLWFAKKNSRGYGSETLRKRSRSILRITAERSIPDY